jgi:hypothetical protein
MSEWGKLLKNGRRVKIVVINGLRATRSRLVTEGDRVRVLRPHPALKGQMVTEICRAQKSSLPAPYLELL